MQKPHSKCIFQSVGVIEADLIQTGEKTYKLDKNGTPYNVLGFSYQCNNRWQGKLGASPTNNIQNRLNRSGSLHGYWHVYPEYVLKDGKFYLSFQIRKRFAHYDNPDKFLFQGAIYKVKPHEVIVAFGRNKGQPRWVHKRTLPLKGYVDGIRTRELWQFNTSLSGYKFTIDEANKVADNSPYIRFG